MWKCSGCRVTNRVVQRSCTLHYSYHYTTKTCLWEERPQGSSIPQATQLCPPGKYGTPSRPASRPVLSPALSLSRGVEGPVEGVVEVAACPWRPCAGPAPCATTGLACPWNPAPEAGPVAGDVAAHGGEDQAAGRPGTLMRGPNRDQSNLAIVLPSRFPSNQITG